MDFDDFKPLFVIIGLAAVLIAGCFLLTAAECNAYADATGRATKMVFGSCYVQTTFDNYIPMEEFNYRAATREQ